MQDTPLTLVSGLAGSGKTTLAADWMEDPGVPWRVVWLTLSEASRVPRGLLVLRHRGLRRAGVELPHSAGVPARQPAGDDLVIRLATDLLDRDEPVVLVLDEVERLTGPDVPRQLELLLRLVGDSLRLVLLSRVDPLLPVQRYRMAGTMTQIRTADLAFTEDEARELLLRSDIHLHDEALHALVAHTEGWAAGLQLTALARANLPAAERNAGAESWLTGAQDANLAEYLTGEVLDAQPEQLRDFLLRTSVLDVICVDLAEELTDDPGAAMALLTLVRGNILMEAGGDLAGCYRAHPLLRELLRAQLAYLTPELVPELHLRAARWFARNGLALQAVSHYGSAGCWQEAAEMVVDDGLIAGALRPSSPPLVQRLADMPEDTPGAPAGVVRAAVALARADVPACDVALDRVERAPGSAPEPALDVALAATRLASAATRARSGPDARVRDAGRGSPQRPGRSGRQPAPVGPTTPTCSRCCCLPRGSPSWPPATCRSAALTLTDAVGACVRGGVRPRTAGQPGAAGPGRGAPGTPEPGP